MVGVVRVRTQRAGCGWCFEHCAI